MLPGPGLYIYRYSMLGELSQSEILLGRVVLERLSPGFRVHLLQETDLVAWTVLEVISFLKQHQLLLRKNL